MSSSKSKRKAGDTGVAEQAGEGSKGKLVVESYTPVDPGPYPQDLPPQNRVRFTPVQTQAIMSGVQPGLTMVVGPPGTGKTDTAVQIMHILYHNCPSQRTLVVTHSNQALNDLFSKVGLLCSVNKCCVLLKELHCRAALSMVVANLAVNLVHILCPGPPTDCRA